MFKFPLFFTILAALSWSAWAQETPARGWYAGFQAGQAETHTGDTEAMFGPFGGFQFNRYIGLEAGLYTVNGLGFESGFGTSTADANAGKLSLAGYLPIGQRFSLFAKGGILVSDIDETSVEDGVIQKRSDTSGSGIFEAGVQFKLLEKWALELSGGRTSIDIFDLRLDFEGDVTFEDKDIDLITLGVRYTF